MKLSVIELKRDLNEFKSMVKYSQHDEEILALNRQISLLEIIIEDLKLSGECIIEEI